MRKILIALAIAIQLGFCNAWAQTSPNCSDLSWNQNESGWGMMLNHQGSILATTTHSPVDYAPKVGTIGQTYAGAFKATAISSAGGFGTTATTVAVNGLPVVIPGGGSSFSCSGTGKSHKASIGNVRSFTDTTSCTGATAPGTSRVTNELVRALVDGKAYP